MAADSTDALMMFEYTTSDPKRTGNGKVAAESATKFSGWSKNASGKGWSSSNDPLMGDFEPGFFFEVDTFDFGVGVNDGEGSSGSEGNGGGGGSGKKTNAIHSNNPADEKQGSKKDGEAAKRSKPRFSRFIYPPNPGQKKLDLDYDIDVHPFSFTRQMDMACNCSPPLSDVKFCLFSVG